jgi:hypothetical protein
MNPNRFRFSIGEKKKKKDSFVMAASKLQAFLNHPAGPKTSQLLRFFVFLFTNSLVSF